MAPQPPKPTNELPPSTIRAENEEAILGTSEDMSTARGATETLDQNPDIDADTGTTRREAIPRSPHDDARSAIAKRFRREEPENERPFNNDMADPENLYGEFGREDDDPDAQLSDEEYDAQAADAERRGEQPERQPQQKDQPRVHKLKVRGQEIEMTDDELLAAARKVKAGDAYLEEARQLLEEAKQVNRRARTAPDRRPHDDDSADEALEPPVHPDEDQPHDPTFVDVVQKIQYGDPEEAGQLLEQIVTKRTAKATDEQALQRSFDQDLARSQKQLKAFADANPDLAADEMSARAVELGMYKLYREDIEALGIEADKIPKDPAQLANWHRFYRVHGYEVRSTSDLLNKSKENFLTWKNGGQKPAPSKNQQPSRQPPRVRVTVDRDQRRMAIPVQPTRGVAPRRDAPPPARGTEVVNQIRRSRGQTVV